MEAKIAFSVAIIHWAGKSSFLDEPTLRWWILWQAPVLGLIYEASIRWHSRSRWLTYYMDEGAKYCLNRISMMVRRGEMKALWHAERTSRKNVTMQLRGRGFSFELARGQKSTKQIIWKQFLLCTEKNLPRFFEIQRRFSCCFGLPIVADYALRLCAWSNEIKDSKIVVVITPTIQHQGESSKSLLPVIRFWTSVALWWVIGRSEKQLSRKGIVNLRCSIFQLISIQIFCTKLSTDPSDRWCSDPNKANSFDQLCQ